jgi:toxoflavin synthase
MLRALPSLTSAAEVVFTLEAIAAGAERVDIVDISPDMMQAANETEKSLGRDGRLGFYEADVSKPLDHLALPQEEYDIVMANWVLDHSGNMEILEGMWRNVSTHLKPGGKLLSVRVSAPQEANYEKYGVIYDNFESIPEGLTYTVRILWDTPLVFEAASMEANYSGSHELPEKYGLTDVQTVPYEKTGTYKKDPGFWEDFMRNPYFCVMTAVKRSNYAGFCARAGDGG